MKKFIIRLLRGVGIGLCLIFVVSSISVLKGKLNFPKVQASPGPACSVSDDLNVTGNLNVGGIYQKGGTAGISSFCPADQTFSGLTASGGILTSAGSCVAIGGGGDVTAVYAGSGLTGGGTSGDVTLNIGEGTGITVGADSLSVKNISFSCGAVNQALKSINIDTGAVTCETDDTGAGGCCSLHDTTHIGATTDLTITTAGLNLNGSGTEGDINNVDEIIGYNDLILRGKSGNNAPIYIEGNPVIINNDAGTGNIGIGTTGPTQKLHVVGNARITGLVSCNTIDTDASGNLVCGTDETGAAGEAYWKLSGSNLYASSTAWNVGIGTTSPNDKLEVKDGSILINADGSRLKLYNVSVPSRKWEIINGYGSATDGLLTFYDRVANAARMVIDPSGNVGIGTTGPTRALDVNGNLRVRNLNCTVNANHGKLTTDASGNVSCADDVGGGGINCPLLASCDGSAAAPSYSFSGASNMGMYRDTTNNRLSFSTAGSERLSIDTSGNVGIGTAPTSGARLVAADATGTSATSYGVYSIGRGTTTSYGIYGFGWATSTAAGTKSYGVYARAAGAEENFSLYAVGSKAYISGALGIGTTDPGTNKLKVAGDTEITGNLNVSKFTNSKLVAPQYWNFSSWNTAGETANFTLDTTYSYALVAIQIDAQADWGGITFFDGAGGTGNQVASAQWQVKRYDWKQGQMLTVLVPTNAKSVKIMERGDYGGERDNVNMVVITYVP